MRAFQHKQFSGLDVHLQLLAVFLVSDLYLVSDEQGESLLVEEFPVGAFRVEPVSLGGVDKVGLMEDGHVLSGLSHGPLLHILLEHVMDHLLLARAVAPTDAQHKGFAVFNGQLAVDLL